MVSLCQMLFPLSTVSLLSTKTSCSCPRRRLPAVFGWGRCSKGMRVFLAIVCCGAESRGLASSRLIPGPPPARAERADGCRAGRIRSQVEGGARGLGACAYRFEPSRGGHGAARRWTLLQVVVAVLLGNLPPPFPALSAAPLLLVRSLAGAIPLLRCALTTFHVRGRELRPGAGQGEGEGPADAGPGARPTAQRASEPLPRP
jgi:hypothetical protein